jgi:hypothetical protein
MTVMNFRMTAFCASVLSTLALAACSDDDDPASPGTGGTGGRATGGTGGATGGTGGSTGGTGGATGGTGGSTGGTGGSTGGTGGSAGAGSTLTLTLDGLEPLGAGFLYEGWLIVDDTPISTGTFQVVTGTSTYDFSVDASDAAAASAFVLTIEPDPDPAAAPAATHVLAGDLSGGMATLSVGHMAALGNDFTSAAGQYLLETPTTMSITDDYDQGVWFLVPSGPSPSLMLPVLPAGWQYEGWVVEPGGAGPISTGRFTSVSGADSDGAGPTAGTDAAPPFPGQDFIDPARVLIGHQVVISIEPEPDDGPAPFAFKPLVDMEVTNVAPPTLQPLTNQAGMLPSGTVMVE